MTTTTDRLLLERVHSGDESAMTVVVDLYGHLLAGVIAATWRGVPQADLEDIMSEVLVDCWRRSKEVDLDRGTFRSWLGMLAKYRTLDHLRQHHKRGSVLARLAALTNPSSADAPEYASDLDALLGALTDTERRLAYVRFIEDRPIQEIARAMGWTDKATSRRVERLRDRLRKTLEEPQNRGASDVRAAR